MASMYIKISGLEKLNQLPGALARAQRDFIQTAAEDLADEIGKAAPGGRGGTIGRSFVGRALSNSSAEIRSDHGGAKANEVGAYITPAFGKKALKFSDGRFRAWARIPALGYAKQALKTRSRVVNDAYQREFDHLGL